MSNAKILIVDDEYLIRWSLSEGLKSEGWRTIMAESGEDGLKQYKAHAPDMVLLDIKLPGIDGVEVLRQIKEADPNIPVMMITAQSQLDIAVTAMKLGAYDYVAKPFDFTDVKNKVRHALENSALKLEVEYLRNTHGGGFNNVIGKTPAMVELIHMAKRIAQSASTTVLLQGESGTGKDVFAQAIHNESNRRDKPFMPINCTALPDELLESELMGYEKGAFTDAKQTKKGLFELADHGTIFLDEVGDMKLGLQAKLLRFLEDRAFKRVGGKEDIEVDVRIIAATNRDLDKAIAERHFREDLYYRLNVIPLTLPPLRERKDDVSLLANHFREIFNREFKVNFKKFSDEAMSLMCRYDWPGNIRELKNAIERAMILSSGDAIDAASLPWKIKGDKPGAQPSATVPNHNGHAFVLPDAGLDIETVERELLVQALEKTSNNQTKAARMLGISRDALRYRMKKFDML